MAVDPYGPYSPYDQAVAMPVGLEKQLLPPAIRAGRELIDQILKMKLQRGLLKAAADSARKSGSAKDAKRLTDEAEQLRMQEMKLRRELPNQQRRAAPKANEPAGET